MVSIIQKPRTNQFLLFWKPFMKWQNYSERTEITSLTWEQRHTPSLETTSNTVLPRTEISRWVPVTPSTLPAFLNTKLFAEIKHLHSTKSKFIPVFRIMSHAVEKAIILFHGDKATELFGQDCIITWISRVSLHLKSVLFLLQLSKEIDVTRPSARIENSFSQVGWPQCQKEKYVLKRWDWYCTVSGKDGIYRLLTVGKPLPRFTSSKPSIIYSPIKHAKK